MIGNKDNEVKVKIMMMKARVPERCRMQRRKDGQKPASKGRKARVDRHTGPPPTGRNVGAWHPAKDTSHANTTRAATHCADVGA